MYVVTLYVWMRVQAMNQTDILHIRNVTSTCTFNKKVFPSLLDRLT